MRYRCRPPLDQVRRNALPEAAAGGPVPHAALAIAPSHAVRAPRYAAAQARRVVVRMAHPAHRPAGGTPRDWTDRFPLFNGAPLHQPRLRRPAWATRPRARRHHRHPGTSRSSGLPALMPSALGRCKPPRPLCRCTRSPTDTPYALPGWRLVVTSTSRSLTASEGVSAPYGAAHPRRRRRCPSSRHCKTCTPLDLEARRGLKPLRT
jgi:hypothetical protein